MIKKDYRPEDIKKLEEKGLHRIWVSYWEHELYPELSNIDDRPQRGWHNSRLSFLKGYETAIKIMENSQ